MHVMEMMPRQHAHQYLLIQTYQLAIQIAAQAVVLQALHQVLAHQVAVLHQVLAHHQVAVLHQVLAHHQVAVLLTQVQNLLAHHKDIVYMHSLQHGIVIRFNGNLTAATEM
jgi:hypothetical protein